MSEVTVVVPAYNAEKYLPETLDSIKNQTVKPKETIVVDDASGDEPWRLKITVVPENNVKNENMQVDSV